MNESYQEDDELDASSIVTNDREIDPYLIVKIADKPEKFIGAAILASFVKTPKDAMFLVKMLGDQVENPAATLGRVFQALDLGTVADYIAAGGHSATLQQWWDDIGISIPVPDEEEVIDDGAVQDVFDEDDYDVQTLYDMVNTSLVKLPQSIRELGDGLFIEVLSKLPAGDAYYTLDHVMQLSKFGTYGTMKEQIEYEQDTVACVVLDDSGSMGRPLGQAIVGAAVNLADSLKCDLILVSSYAYRFPAGTFNTDSVMARWENGWTFYNQLIPYFRDISQSYDVVVTIADYDSVPSHKEQILRACSARIQVLYDICVQYTEDGNGNIRTSYLAECLGQLADRVVPVFVGAPGLKYSK